MRHHTARVGLAALLVLSAGCDASEDFDVFALVGTYSGTRAIVDAGDTDSEAITFTVAADEAAGAVTLTLRPESGAPEVLEGTYDDDGIEVAVSQSGVTIDFSASPGGAIAGDYSAFGQTGTISGTLTPSRFDLTFLPAGPDGARTEIRTSR